MLLVLDVGTSVTHLALFEGERMRRKFLLPTLSSVDRGKIPVALVDSVRCRLGCGRIEAVAIASVVPELQEALIALCEQHVCRPAEFVGESLPSPIPVRYDQPGSAGADRIANAVAGSRGHGAPVVVFDFGTATTVDVVSADGAFVGGMILPGFALTFQALRERAPHLPLLGMPPRGVPKPVPLIGGSTEECLRSGLYYGAIAQVEGIIRRLGAELGPETPMVATGGLSHVFAGERNLFTEIDRDLTLHGIRLIWEASHSNR
jgi:type III pantothenate kinase